jgi:hypothetical protein
MTRSASYHLTGRGRTAPLGIKGGKGQGSFVRDTRRQIIGFYGDIVQNLKAWQAKRRSCLRHLMTSPQSRAPSRRRSR